MHKIQSAIATNSAEYRHNFAHNKRLSEIFCEKQDKARSDRPARDVNRLRGQGKMLARERLEKLLDPATPFL
jgi:3-methylcrotonyl-CoA carboxylase beta subunit